MEKNNVSIVDKEFCCGCRLCSDICSKEAISFIKEEDGFYYPIINESKCINCGLCYQKCPIIKQSLNEKASYSLSGFAKEDSIKELGSSGGFFPLLAFHLIDLGWKIYGAAFDENLNLKHCGVNDKKNLFKLFKSKYLQSNCDGIYKAIKEDLKQNKTVLFCGTPCQSQALKNYIPEKLIQNLYIVDFVCHGVPSQDLFNKNIKWYKNRFNFQITNVEFRYKSKKVKHPQTLKFEYIKNNNKYSALKLHYQDPFYFGFQKHLTLRKSCYKCLWARPERCSDLTISDFWEIETIKNDLDSKKGVSCILLNTQKGFYVYEKVQEKLGGKYRISIDFAIKNNECLYSPTKLPEKRTEFFLDLNKRGYDFVVEKYLKSKKKWIFDIYYSIPKFIRDIVRKIMINKIKYE